MAAPPEQDFAAEEVDIWWGAYAGRTMVPRFVGCAILSALVVGMAWSVGAWRGAFLIRYGAGLIVAGLWLSQVGLWIYRMLALNYRLTTRHLYYERGFGHPGNPGIELGQITAISVMQGAVERWLGVGRIAIAATGNRLPLVLEGVRHANAVASEISRRVKQAQNALS
jgi:hypothetical protein